MSSTFDHTTSTVEHTTSPHLSSAPTVLIFDSGVGGLSILDEVQRKSPTANLIYASDNAAFPYGTKGEEELIARVHAVLTKITTLYPIDIIVIACNTASTLTLPHVRSHFKQAVVGVVPAIKPAAARSQSQVIGLLATPATVARPYTHALIREHAPHAEIISVGSSELVHLAEHKLRGNAIDHHAMAKILAPFLDHPRAALLDTLVLACTHFPLMREEIAQHFSPNVALIDSGEAIARRVHSLLPEHATPAMPTHRALFTQSTPAVIALQPQLQPFGITTLDIIDV